MLRLHVITHSNQWETWSKILFIVLPISRKQTILMMKASSYTRNPLREQTLLMSGWITFGQRRVIYTLSPIGINISYNISLPGNKTYTRITEPDCSCTCKILRNLKHEKDKIRRSLICDNMQKMSHGNWRVGANINRNTNFGHTNGQQGFGVQNNKFKMQS